MKKLFYFILFIFSFITKLPARADTDSTITQQFLATPELADARVGISVYNLDLLEKIISIDENKKFTPASNLKILTTYLAQKYLPDSLVAFYFQRAGDTLKIIPTGDPTLLHPDFDNRRASDFFDQVQADSSLRFIQLNTSAWCELPFAKGWIWEDYTYNFMAENSLMPFYSNLVDFRLVGGYRRSKVARGALFFTPNLYSFTRFSKVDTVRSTARGYYTIKRVPYENLFYIAPDKYRFYHARVPLITNGSEFAERVLNKLTQKKILVTTASAPATYTTWQTFVSHARTETLHTMLSLSDNFIAEQLLLMISREHLGYIKRDSIIAYLYPTVFPATGAQDSVVWADGSGLSMYNLFTPTHFVRLLDSLYRRGGKDNIRAIFPTGGDGTLKNIFENYRGFVFAKTGSMSNVFCMSGFFIGKKTGQWHAFSVLTNHVLLSTSRSKRILEDYITKLIEQY